MGYTFSFSLGGSEMRREKLNRIKETLRLGIYRSSGLFIQLSHQIAAPWNVARRRPNDVLDINQGPDSFFLIAIQKFSSKFVRFVEQGESP
jgi:hypothetical protein